LHSGEAFVLVAFVVRAQGTDCSGGWINDSTPPVLVHQVWTSSTG
jgi:hypothetical protein